MAYAYQQVGPFTCNNMAHQTVTILAASGTILSVGLQILYTGSATSFYPSQMYIENATTAVVEVVNTYGDLTASQPYTSWSVWLVIDTGGSSTSANVEITFTSSSAVN